MKRNIVALALVFSALMSGCETSERTLSLISAADSIASAMPDSALQIMRMVNRRRVYGPTDRAAYSLTYSRVADFCNIEIDLDTLVAPAVGYYTKNGPDDKAACALYYLALVHENGHRDSLAVKTAVEAQRLAEQAGDHHTAGLACSCMGRIYDQQLFFARAVEAYDHAAQAFEAAGERRNLMYVYINRSDNYTTQLDYDHAIADDSLALEIAVELCDTLWIRECISSIAKSLFWQTDDPQPSLKMLLHTYDTYCGGKVPNNDLSILYQLYEARGESETAMDYLNRAFEKRDRHPLNAQPGMYLLMSQAAANRGDYKKALEYYDEVLSLNDSIYNNILANSLLAAEHRYHFDLQESENEHAISKKRTQIAALSVVIIFITAIALYIVVRERRLKRREIEEMLDAIDKQRNSKNALVAELDAHVERERRLKELLETRFNDIRTLAAKYYTYGSDEKRLRKEIEKLTSTDVFDEGMFATIEEVVNAKNSDVIVKLRKHAALTTEEIHLLLLVYAQFTNEEISAVMGLSVSNTAVRKTRLRKRLADFIALSPDYLF